ncbi:GNAT family N-acetyltransferase [Nocardioides sp. CBS4Y-1]|uniref:GNAT family N-acetyltransferase n=1 Tax=Nocardioides acrostichi TaxID=2784339 RepID=A0A930UYE4_9ACTN|nr:GNAT family N-acetyltransferase [Nocardioides acrostichi]
MVVVRDADVGDADAVAASEAENLGADAWSPGLIEAGLSGDVPTVRYLVAERVGPEGPVVVGHAVISVVPDIAELQRIAVDAGARRGGAATALLDAALSAAREGRADRVLLEVREDNSAALSFYAARGFIEIDRRPRYYRDGTTAVVMRRGIGPSCG